MDSLVGIATALASVAVAALVISYLFVTLGKAFIHNVKATLGLKSARGNNNDN